MSPLVRTDAAATWRRIANGQKHCTSGLLSGPLTGTLLHSLKVNIGCLEKREKVRFLVFARRCLSARASLRVTAPSRSALPWPDRALAHALPGEFLRRWSPYPGVPCSLVWHEFMRQWRQCLRHAPTASDGRVLLLALLVSILVCFVLVAVCLCSRVSRLEVHERT